MYIYSLEYKSLLKINVLTIYKIIYFVDFQFYMSITPNFGSPLFPHIIKKKESE